MASGSATPYAAESWRHQTDDPGAHRHRVRSRARQPAGADEHGRRTLGVAKREAAQIDEKLFFELFATPAPTQAKVACRRRLRPVPHSTSDLVGLSVLGHGAGCDIVPQRGSV